MPPTLPHKLFETAVKKSCYDKIIDWFFNFKRISIEAPMFIPQSGEYDGCYCFKAIITGSEDYKLKVLFEAEPFPTREKALIKAIEEAFKIITV